MNVQQATTLDQLKHMLCERLHSAAEQVDIRIEPEERVVLRGQLSTFYQKQLAQEAILSSSPGWHVDNRIEVL